MTYPTQEKGRKMYTAKMVTEGYGQGYFKVVNEKGITFGGLHTSYDEATSTAARLNNDIIRREENLRQIERNGISF